MHGSSTRVPARACRANVGRGITAPPGRHRGDTLVAAAEWASGVTLRDVRRRSHPHTETVFPGDDGQAGTAVDAWAPETSHRCGLARQH